jgi:hypothetical protein
MIFDYWTFNSYSFMANRLSFTVTTPAEIKTLLPINEFPVICAQFVILVLEPIFELCILCTKVHKMHMPVSRKQAIG